MTSLAPQDSRRAAAAERARRHRERQRRREMMVSVLVSIDLVVGYLLDEGWLTESESEDPRVVARQISKLLRKIAMKPREITVTRHAPSTHKSGSF